MSYTPLPASWDELFSNSQLCDQLGISLDGSVREEIVTQRLSRSLTLIACLDRLHLLSSKKPLLIHVAGAGIQEGADHASASEQFASFSTLMGKYSLDVTLVLIGPNAPPPRLWKPSLSSSRVSIDCFHGYYDEYSMSPQYSVPSLVVAFNAGVWGYDAWLPTFDKILHLHLDRDVGSLSPVPIVITSYNMFEALDDADTLEDHLCDFDWLWPHTPNPFAARQLLREETIPMEGEGPPPPMYENAAWQCIAYCEGGPKETS